VRPLIARHLSQPTGVLGRIVGRLMNRNNAKMNAFAVKLLELTPDDRVLEVGFGGGVGLPSLIATAAYVAGVDRSPVMVQQANTNFAGGRLWTSLGVGFAELHRVLSPGGRLVVGFLPKEWMDRMGYPTDIFTSRSPEEVVAALNEAGFRDVRVERPEPTTRSIVVIANR
jgi:arsenite methyltransferase